MTDSHREPPSDLQRLTEELERERERLVVAQAVARVGSWETDLRTLQVVWSAETYRIFGVDPASYRPDHESFLSFVHPDDRATVDAAFRESFATRDVCTIEHRVVCADGSQKVVEERWQTFVDASGTPVRAAGTCQDITERKRLESLHFRAQRLESLGTLAGGIAHDLNNVLTPILAAVDLLRAETDPVEREHSLATIESSARRGADMVRQVLAFARGGSGDATQLHQVLMNLCLNARDAMPQGGALSIGAANETLDDVYAGMNPQARPGQFLRLTVSDTGSGIPPAVQERMFEPFFTTKELGKGTGLGLSTVHSIVKAFGGFVNVYSEPGKGARFVVYLPALGDSGAVERRRVAAPALPQGRGELILVVDDEEAIRNVLRRTLERNGYRVSLASNGAEGVAAFVDARQELRLVLTDMAMPVLDGPSMIRAIRAMEPSLPIVGSSGLTGLDAGGLPDDLRVDGWVPKPYSADLLLGTIRAVLDTAAAADR